MRFFGEFFLLFSLKKFYITRRGKVKDRTARPPITFSLSFRQSRKCSSLFAMETVGSFHPSLGHFTHFFWPEKFFCVNIYNYYFQ